MVKGGNTDKVMVCIHNEASVFELIIGLNLAGFSITSLFVSIAIFIFLSIR
jgi:hypothetical protein